MKKIFFLIICIFISSLVFGKDDQAILEHKFDLMSNESFYYFKCPYTFLTNEKCLLNTIKAKSNSIGDSKITTDEGIEITVDNGQVYARDPRDKTKNHKLKLHWENSGHFPVLKDDINKELEHYKPKTPLTLQKCIDGVKKFMHIEKNKDKCAVESTGTSKKTPLTEDHFVQCPRSLKQKMESNDPLMLFKSGKNRYAVGKKSKSVSSLFPISKNRTIVRNGKSEPILRTSIDGEATGIVNGLYKELAQTQLPAIQAVKAIGRALEQVHKSGNQLTITFNDTLIKHDGSDVIFTNSDNFASKDVEKKEEELKNGCQTTDDACTLGVVALQILSGPNALGRTDEEIKKTINNISEEGESHPLVKVLSETYGDELADTLVATVKKDRKQRPSVEKFNEVIATVIKNRKIKQSPLKTDSVCLGDGDDELKDLPPIEIAPQDTSTIKQNYQIGKKAIIYDTESISNNNRGGILISSSGDRYAISSTLTKSNGEKIQGGSGKLQLAVSKDGVYAAKVLRLQERRFTEEGKQYTNPSDLNELSREIEYTQKYGGAYAPKGTFQTKNNNAIIILPLMAGDVENLINQAGPNNTKQLVDFVMLKSSEQLQKMHKDGIIHSDIKPENIMFNSKGDVSLTDFGSTVAIKQLHSNEANPSSTPGFAAPEIFLTDDLKKISTRSDIYSLGMTAVNLLVGKPLINIPNINTSESSKDYEKRVIQHLSKFYNELETIISNKIDKKTNKLNTNSFSKNSSSEIEKSLSELCEKDKESCEFILTKMIRYSPENRASINEVNDFFKKRSKDNTELKKTIANIGLSKNKNQEIVQGLQSKLEKFENKNGKKAKAIYDRISSIAEANQKYRDEHPQDNDLSLQAENMIFLLNATDSTRPITDSRKKEIEQNIANFWETARSFSNKEIIEILSDNLITSADDDDDNNSIDFFMKTIEKSALKYGMRRSFPIDELKKSIRERKGSLSDEDESADSDNDRFR